jgi:pyroglutamyl-peptidase
MKKILMAGFEPFGQDKINPALEAIKILDGKQLNGGIIVSCEVPVVRYKAIDVVMDAVKKHQPDIVITIGQAAGRAEITPERIAINIDDYRIPDNEGNQIIDEPIVDNGPAGYFSTLPIKAIVEALQQENIPAQVSNTAGSFVCNHLFYGLQHRLVNTKITHGFVHIPLLPDQAKGSNKPSMPLMMIVEGLTIIAQAALDNKQDKVIGGGTIC